MVQNMFQHEVENFDSWYEGFNSEPAQANRKKHGIGIKGIYRGYDNPSYVTVISEAESKENYDGMMADPDFQNAMKNAGVVGQPNMLMMREHK